MEELVVLVDEKNQPIATAPKNLVHHNHTPLHRGFSVFVFNPKGELLLQQRSKNKITWPQVWSNSCCGHPLPSESNIEAIKRRLKYELGINKVEITDILSDYRYKFENKGIWENEICPVFVGFTREQPVINKKEVEDIKWVKWEEFVKEINDSPENYSPWCREETKLLSQDKTFLRLFK